MSLVKVFLIYIVTLFIILGNTPALAVIDLTRTGPVQHREITDLLSYQDLVQLSETEYTDKDLRQRLHLVLYNPMVDNTIAPKNSKANKHPILDDYVRVGSWNIGRGRNLDLIKMIFKDPEKFYEKIKNKNKFDKDIQKEVEILRDVDILMINEADIGMPRTRYKNIPRELAKTLGFNYAFGTEFVEIDPVHLGLEKYKWSEENLLFPDKEYIVDKDKYKGLHGNAILSRYPLKNVRIVRLPSYYDWFNDEKERVVEIEYLRRKAAGLIFNEAIFREIRQGSRMALLADVEIPGAEQPLTVIAVHLENRTVPEFRYKQIKVLLDEIKKIKNPVVLGGDFNTTTTDGRPTTIKREIRKKITDPDFIGKQIVRALVPYSMIVSGGQLVGNFIRKHRNPTVMSIPIISPNDERQFFNAIKDLQFADGGKFDFDGDMFRATNSRWGMLANSNERRYKGFVATFIFDRDWYIGKFKLDWLFVKPGVTDDEDELGIFAPFFGTTLDNLNYSLYPPVSDHTPITVDLPLKSLNKEKVEKRKDILKALEVRPNLRTAPHALPLRDKYSLED